MDVFTVKWDTGFINININNYFAKAGISDIKKLFKLCCQHSTEDERKHLIADIESSKHYWTEKFNEDKRGKTYGVTATLTPRTPKQLETLMDKLDKVLECLNEHRWGIKRCPIIGPKQWGLYSGVS